MSIINISPEAIVLLNQLCDPGNLEETITTLDAAEEKMQEMASGEFNDAQKGYNLYDLAYTIKGYKKDLMKLKGLLENERDSE